MPGLTTGKGGSGSIHDPRQMTEDTHLKVLKLLEDNPQITQRQLASELGFSLGKAN
jgi:DNA-binding Lrp family transcriptional regulator